MKNNLERKGHRYLLVTFLIVSLFICLYTFTIFKSSKVADISLVESKLLADTAKKVVLLSEFYNFEGLNEKNISAKEQYSGINSFRLTSDVEFGFTSNKFFKNIPTFKNLEKVIIKYNCLIKGEDPSALYVLTIFDKQSKSVYWKSQPIVEKKKNKWFETGLEFNLPKEFLQMDYRLCLYAWNKNKKEFYMDDISIFYIQGKSTSYISDDNFSKTNLFFDFEETKEYIKAEDENCLSTHSGLKAYTFKNGDEFGSTIRKKISDFGVDKLTKISMSAWVYPLTDNTQLALTASIFNQSNENLLWQGKETSPEHFKKNKWTKLNASFVLPSEKFSNEHEISVGVWNKGKTNLIFDDLEIVYGERSYRESFTPEKENTEKHESKSIDKIKNSVNRKIYFEKQEINNKNTASITPPIANNETNNFSPQDEYFVGDFFDGNNKLQEILFFNKKVVQLFSYSNEMKQFKKLWETNADLDSLWNQNNSIYSGNFDTKQGTDILIFNKLNRSWKMLNFNGKKWLIISSGFELQKQWVLKNESEEFLPGNYLSDTTTFLKINTSWRLDVQLFEKSATGFNLKANIDFKGYSLDYNPKYFEMVKIISGNFLFENQTSLLLIMGNCADANFSGNYCKQLDNLQFLPNSTQLYSFKK